MSARAAFRQADVTRAIRGALKAGLKAGEFEVKATDDGIRVLTYPTGAVVTSDDQDEAAWSGAMAKWQRSA